MPFTILYANNYHYSFPVHKAQGVVLITGASRGLGHQAALSFDKKGYHVFAGFRNNTDGEKLRQELGPNSQPVRLDVTDSAQCEAAITAVESYMTEKNVPFVALINNAGIVLPAVVECTSDRQLGQQLEVSIIVFLPW